MKRVSIPNRSLLSHHLSTPNAIYQASSRIVAKTRSIASGGGRFAWGGHDAEWQAGASRRRCGDGSGWLSNLVQMCREQEDDRSDLAQANFYDRATGLALPQFDEAISNPPLGDVVTDCDTDKLAYRGPVGLTAAAIGLKVTRLGIIMILPQTYTPYRFSGRVSGQNVATYSHVRALAQFTARHPRLEWGLSEPGCGVSRLQSWLARGFASDRDCLTY